MTPDEQKTIETILELADEGELDISDAQYDTLIERLHGRSWDEIAEEYDMSRSGIYHRFYSARESLYAWQARRDGDRHEVDRTLAYMLRKYSTEQLLSLRKLIDELLEEKPPPR